MKKSNRTVLALSASLLALIALFAGFPAASASATDLDCSAISNCGDGGHCDGPGTLAGCRLTCDSGPSVDCGAKQTF